MTERNAKWELEILLNHRMVLQRGGRELDYSEQSRMKDLRSFLDGIDKPEDTTKPEPGETAKPKNDIPF